jgi:hypothetical protein
MATLQPWPHKPLTPDDRADTAILAAAEALGYRLAVQCTECGQWLVADQSVRLHIGPVCRNKSKAPA